jgi:hypothetical protein
MRCRFLFVLTLLVCSLPGLALAWMERSGQAEFMNACPKELPSAQIRITTQMYDPPVYQNYSITELSGFPARTSAYPSDAVTHTYGLTRNPLEFLVESQIGISINQTSHKRCYWYDSVTLTLRLKPEIFMGREIKPGSCYFNAVLKHELQHADIERKLLQDYQPIITKTITDFIQKTGFIRNIDEGHDEQVYAHLKQAMSSQIDLIHSYMEPVRGARQAEIDTVASYEATAAPCRQVEKAPY